MEADFPKRSCSNNKLERDDDSKISHPALRDRPIENEVAYPAPACRSLFALDGSRGGPATRCLAGCSIPQGSARRTSGRTFSLQGPAGGQPLPVSVRSKRHRDLSRHVAAALKAAASSCHVAGPLLLPSLNFRDAHLLDGIIAPRSTGLPWNANGCVRGGEPAEISQDQFCHQAAAAPRSCHLRRRSPGLAKSTVVTVARMTPPKCRSKCWSIARRRAGGAGFVEPSRSFFCLWRYSLTVVTADVVIGGTLPTARTIDGLPNGAESSAPAAMRPAIQRWANCRD